MAESLLVLYVVVVVLAAVVVRRVPLLQPPAMLIQRPGVFGLLYFSMLVAGAGLGFLAPEAMVRWTGGAATSVPLQELASGILTRFAQAIGALAGAWIALRGLYVWTILGLLYGAVLLVAMILDWVLLGR